jgi:hypothetical protein
MLLSQEQIRRGNIGISNDSIGKETMLKEEPGVRPTFLS